MRPAFVYGIAAFTAALGAAALLYRGWLDGAFFLALAASVALNQRAAETGDGRVRTASRVAAALTLLLLLADIVLTFA